jgi:hypothetical protein
VLVLSRKGLGDALMDPRGRWRHYKGHEYEVVGVAKHSETLEELGIAYMRMDADEVWVWVRPKEMFSQTVDIGVKQVARFELLSRKTIKERVAELERQLGEPGYVDALRTTCEEVAQLIPTKWREDQLEAGRDYDQLEALPSMVGDYISELRERAERAEQALNQFKNMWPTEEDKPLPEDAQISDAHPLRTNDHKTYAEAVRLVSAKHSKYALVDLVNWLLWRISIPKKQKEWVKK